MQEEEEDEEEEEEEAEKEEEEEELINLQALASQQVWRLVAEPQQPCLVSFICVKQIVSDIQTDMLRQQR